MGLEPPNPARKTQPRRRLDHAKRLMCSGVGPTGSEEAARLHWWKTLTWSDEKVPTAVCKTPRLWKSMRSFSDQSCG